MRGKPCHRRAILKRTQWVHPRPQRNRHRTARFGRHPRGEEFGNHAAFGQARHAVARHRLNLGRDTVDDIVTRGRWIEVRVAVVEPVHIRQQDELIRAAGHGNLGRQTVVIAITDFIGRNRIVFVHDRRDAQ